MKTVPSSKATTRPGCEAEPDHPEPETTPFEKVAITLLVTAVAALAAIALTQHTELFLR